MADETVNNISDADSETRKLELNDNSYCNMNNDLNVSKNINSPEYSCAKFSSSLVISENNKSNINADLNKVDSLEASGPSHSTNRESSADQKCKTKPSSSSHKSKHCSPRKHKTKHCKKRKWKPYMKLTWSERQRLEERDSRRACRIREEMSAHGLPLAPYNTTQFLMEDHDLEEPDYDQKPETDPKSPTGSEEYYYSPADEQVFLQKQFSETYDSFHDDYINAMSKYELVCELMRLEDEVEQLERALSEARKERMERSEDSVEADLEKIQVFHEEIIKMTQENDDLNNSNYQLYEQLQQKS